MEEAGDEDYPKCTSCVSYWQRRSLQENNLWGEEHGNWMIFLHEMYSLTELKFNWKTLLRYFHYELQCTVREMEGGIYEKMSTYLGTLARWSCHRHRQWHHLRDHVKFQFTYSHFRKRKILFVRTELLTCSALVNSYNNIKQQAERITRLEDHFSLVPLVPLFLLPTIDNLKWLLCGREYNYRCYLKSYTCLGDHVQWVENIEGHL